MDIGISSPEQVLSSLDDYQRSNISKANSLIDRYWKEQRAKGKEIRTKISVAISNKAGLQASFIVYSPTIKVVSGKRGITYGLTWGTAKSYRSLGGEKGSAKKRLIRYLKYGRAKTASRPPGYHLRQFVLEEAQKWQLDLIKEIEAEFDKLRHIQFSISHLRSEIYKNTDIKETIASKLEAGEETVVKGSAYFTKLTSVSDYLEEGKPLDLMPHDLISFVKNTASKEDLTDFGVTEEIVNELAMIATMQNVS